MTKITSTQCLVISAILTLSLSSSHGQLSFNDQIVFRNKPEPIQSYYQYDRPPTELISRTVLEMAHDIGTRLLQESKEKTVVYSPLSIYGALCLLLLGANGGTYDELMRFLNFDHDATLNNSPSLIHKEFGLLMEKLARDNRPLHQLGTQSTRKSDESNSHVGDEMVEHRINIANGLFVQNGFSIRPEYQTAAINTYSTELKSLDFKLDAGRSTKYINEWVSEHTEGKIPEVFGDTLDPATKLVVVSALYFKAMWDTTFMVDETKQRPFYVDGRSNPPQNFEMMITGGKFPYYDSKEYDCRILGLPYKHNLSTMYVILPNNSTKQRLNALQASLRADHINEMISKMRRVSAIVVFPKLHISNTIDLDETLKQFGVNSLFNGVTSDLSLLSTGKEQYHAAANEHSSAKHTAAEPFALRSLDRLRHQLSVLQPSGINPGLYADRVLHKIDLTVNEMGTDGGAVSAVTLYKTGPDTYFRADAPFMFFIRHDATELPLFYGAVYEPTNIFRGK